MYLNLDSIYKSDVNYVQTMMHFQLSFSIQIIVKVGAPIIMFRNMDQSAGLCNGTCMVVDYLGDRVIQATIIS